MGSARFNPNSASELVQDEEFQRKVSQLLAANLQPISHRSQGKRSYAHAHIFRVLGAKKWPWRAHAFEYNFGIIQMAKHYDGGVKDAIMHYLEAINEDSINYAWTEVRNWFEEVCIRIAERLVGARSLE